MSTARVLTFGLPRAPSSYVGTWYLKNSLCEALLYINSWKSNTVAQPSPSNVEYLEFWFCSGLFCCVSGTVFEDLGGRRNEVWLWGVSSYPLCLVCRSIAFHWTLSSDKLVLVSWACWWYLSQSCPPLSGCWVSSSDSSLAWFGAVVRWKRCFVIFWNCKSRHMYVLSILRTQTRKRASVCEGGSEWVRERLAPCVILCWKICIPS